MTLLRLDNVSLAYGHLPLLAHVDFQIEPGERVCLVGRNGTGKSTLLRAITGAALPDDGEIWCQETLRIGHLEQEVPPDTEQTVFEVVAAGLGELGALLTEYHLVTHQAGAAERSSLARLAELQARIDRRVRALQAMRRERRQRLEAPGKARFGIDAGGLSGKLVVDLRRVSFRYGDNVIIRDLSTRILRGDRVGIIGPNGCGKSTLLKLILGEMAPTGGEVVIGTRLKVAYFDQHRGRMNPEKTVRENMSEESDYVTVKGRSRHVIGYLKDFLFPPERIDSPVMALSGGERNRLLLAKIFAGSANMMVLDEPTNDLDVDTLELLEDLLADYEGTLLLVSHDRTFLDNVVTSTLVFEGEGKVGEFIGGYEDWERYRRLLAAERTELPKRAGKPPPAAALEEKRGNRTHKLSYKEQRELEALPGKIESLEAEQSRLHTVTSDAEFYKQPGDKIAAAMERLEAVTNELEACYACWESLESDR